MSKSNTYKCRMVAKSFPKMQEGILDKITVANGFTMKEVREYKGKLRNFAIKVLEKKNPPCDLIDGTSLFHIMYMNRTPEGFGYWNDLDTRLGEV